MELVGSKIWEVSAFPALFWIPLLPLIGAVLAYSCVGLGKDRQSLSGWVASFAALASFAGSVLAFWKLSLCVEQPGLQTHLWNWMSIGSLSVDVALRFDHLSAVMSLIVTGVGALIHFYAIGYMADDESKPRFFAYLNLFLFAMLTLVLGDNLFVMFVGWEGVGLCSYLLIGFWHKNMDNARAGQKAFVVNKIGDIGFVLGMVTLIAATGSLEFPTIAAGISARPDLIELAAFMLFIGAVGKSAQIPLYIWLPDAMAGPTPVSALIHAATMVTSGVYMIARMSFLYEQAPDTLVIISVIGTLTAFFAASVALVQNDIKKVLAYSTISQLGFMFMALGAQAFSNGIFHVVTHAFFKACLFMGAGSVIMGCHHEQDMRKFGGLRKLMPYTFLSYLIATLAISGFPGLSGFYSKDKILWAVYSSPSLGAVSFPGLLNISLAQVLCVVGLLSALMTAFYMTRTLMMTFFGKYRGHAHPHESPKIVTIPLLILAALSLGFGYLYGGTLLDFLGVWTRPDLKITDHAGAHGHMSPELVLEGLSIGVALLGIVLGIVIYRGQSQVPAVLVNRFGFIYRTLKGKWWVDEFYRVVFAKPLEALAMATYWVVDRWIIDGGVNAIAASVDMQSETLRGIQSGRVCSYALLMLGGLVAVLLGMGFLG